MSENDLRARIERELADSQYINRSHYHRKTYDAGCRGPLCSQAVSERQAALRQRVAQSPPRANSRTVRRLAELPELAQIASEYGITVNTEPVCV